MRARVRDDLDSLRGRYLPDLSRTRSFEGSDYEFRGHCRSEQWAVALARMAMDTHYGNFKAEVERVQGPARARVYGRIWQVMREATEQLETESAERLVAHDRLRRPTPRKRS